MKDDALRRRMNRLKESPRLKGDSWTYYENWLNKKSLKTRVHYLRHVIGFLEWLDTDTESLFELYLGMIKDKDIRKKKKMGISVVGYQKHLMESRGMKGSSTHMVLCAIMGFFKANELPFKPEEKIINDSVETPNTSLEQIREVLNATGSYKIKAYILFARDSGLRTGDISNLPIRIFREAIDDPSIEYYTFTWKQKKTKRNADPVIGPECLEALRIWMNYRVNTLKISDKDDDPLFCIEKANIAYTDKLGRYISEVVRGGWIDDGSMSVCFRGLVRKADLKPLHGNTRLPTIHSLRVFHKTMLEYSGVQTSWINKMQGRAGEGTGGIYTKPNPDQIIEIFKRGYSAMSGIEESQLEKITKLTRELGISQYELAEIREERDKYRAGYEERIRLQAIIDKAILEGWPEDIIKKLEESLQSADNFEEGVTHFRKLQELALAPYPISL